MLEGRIKDHKLQIVSDKKTIKEMTNEFSTLEPGYQYNPRVRSGFSDGRYKFYKLFNIPENKDLAIMELELGFIQRVNRYFNSIVVGTPQQFTKDEITLFLKKEIPNLPFKLRKYQLKMIYGMLQSERHLGILSTGGGKSLVAYLVIKFLIENNWKSILVVPTINLVDQMYSDFLAYGASEDFLNSIQRIGGDYKDKKLKGDIVISTWQSLKNLKKDINEYQCLLIDEAHKAKADVLNGILKTNIQKKIGMTGSMPIIKIDSMKLEEIFGEPKIYANAKDLIELGLLTKTSIIAVFLNYPRKDTRASWKYQQESKFIREYPKRLEYTANLINKVSNSGITVATFNTSKFGEELYEKVSGKKLGKDRNSFERQKACGVFFISGKTKPELREKIRLYLNSEISTDEKLIAQTTTIDTGINIPKLKNFVFAEFPGKSFTKILQSIGRVMRKSEDSGDSVYVWDIVDCFDYTNENYTLKHFWDRQKFYEAEGHPIHEKEIQLE